MVALPFPFYELSSSPLVLQSQSPAYPSFMPFGSKTKSVLAFRVEHGSVGIGPANGEEVV